MKVKIIGPSLISVTCEQPRKYRATKRVRVQEPGYSYLKTVNDGVIETSFEVEIEIGSLLQALGHKAATSKAGKSILQRGAIKLRAVNRKHNPNEEL